VNGLLSLGLTGGLSVTPRSALQVAVIIVQYF
jgi:hypothetical protein